MIDESAIAQRIAAKRIGKKRPDDMFKALFFDIREEAKRFIDREAQNAIRKMDAALKSDLAGRGLQGNLEMKLGKFKGHPYVASANLVVKPKQAYEGDGDPRALALLSHLQEKYSPKFKLKNVRDGIATFNVR